MNFFTESKKPDILRLICNKSVTSGKPVQWNKKDDFKCNSVTLKDDINIEIKEDGWYQTILRLVVKQYNLKKDILSKSTQEETLCFLAAIQQNSEAISLYYSDLNNSGVITTVCLNDINYFEKGEVITVAVGMCNILNVQEKQNIFNIMKI